MSVLQKIKDIEDEASYFPFGCLPLGAPGRLLPVATSSASNERLNIFSVANNGAYSDGQDAEKQGHHEPSLHAQGAHVIRAWAARARLAAPLSTVRA